MRLLKRSAAWGRAPGWRARDFRTGAAPMAESNRPGGQDAGAQPVGGAEAEQERAPALPELDLGREVPVPSLDQRRQETGEVHAVGMGVAQEGVGAVKR